MCSSLPLLISGEIGGTFFGIGCLPYVLLACFTCAVGDGGALFGVDKRTCRYWIQYPAIGSNTGLDRRSKIEDARKSFWAIFNLRSSIQASIGSNTGVFNFNTGPSQKLKIHWKVQHLRHPEGLTCCTFPPSKPTP